LWSEHWIWLANHCLFVCFFHCFFWRKTLNLNLFGAIFLLSMLCTWQKVKDR
jgi:hypothetical protein